MGNKILELLQKKVTKQMPRELLEQHIVGFLESHNMCILATAKGSIPRATPIEYYSQGTMLYMVGEPGIKTNNIMDNPQVSVGIHDSLNGWLSVKGVQITGSATLITDENPGYNKAMQIYKWQELGRELGQNKPPSGRIIIKIKAKKIELTEIALKQKGYALRQIWEIVES
ncbi:pyridoxamine 5'-phosphate oxidase family protein [Chloroflexota bacterium]